jgi:glutamate 5-kinase
MSKTPSNCLLIKLGTQVVVDETGPAMARLENIVKEVAKLAEERPIVLVSSGAVGLGRRALKLKAPLELAQKQACAAVGQSILMNLYRELFGKFEIEVAQVLVTAQDFSDRNRYLNLRNSFEELLSLGVIPIVNENDVVSTAGIVEDGTLKSFDDNDKLSSLVAGKLGADTLIILTNVDGVFDANPSENPNAKLIPEITSFSQLQSVDTQGQSSLGRGGMSSKLLAARMAGLCGVKTIIASGMGESPIASALSGKSGTTIVPKEILSDKKRWIGTGSGYSGVVVVNECAVEVLLRDRASVLPVGVVDVVGEFDVQDVISIQDDKGLEIGRGLATMGSSTLRKVKGKHTKDVRTELQAGEKDEVSHRNNLVIFGD